MTDLPEETGFIPDPDWYRTTYGEDWRFSESVNMAIGQGEVQVTPLQVARWYSAIANGGSLPTPYLVAQYGLIGEDLHARARAGADPIGHQAGSDRDDPQRHLRGDDRRASARRSSSSATRRCKRLASAARPARRKPAAATRSRTPGSPRYAPRENPQVVVVAMVETSGEGSEVAAPIVREVMETYFGMTN